MDLNYKKLLLEVENKELKEWRSKKEFDKYILQENRWRVIGWIKHKTLKKWEINIDWRDWRNEEDYYILQKGQEYYFLIFRRVNSYWR